VAGRREGPVVVGFGPGTPSLGALSDGDLAAAIAQGLRLPRPVRLAARRLLHAAPGRAVERVEVDGWPGGRALVAKWRDDCVRDREALLYQGLAPAVLHALGAPRCLGTCRCAGLHVLLLEWVDGRAARWDRPADIRRAFAHLGRLHARTAGLVAAGAGRLASADAWAELVAAGRHQAAGGTEPMVLDPGDLHGDNVLLLPGGGVCLLDFENMALRPRRAALRQLWEDSSLPQGRLAELAWATYWEAAAWPGPPPAGPAAEAGVPAWSAPDRGDGGRRRP
jgi:hypothetical protein